HAGCGLGWQGGHRCQGKNQRRKYNENTHIKSPRKRFESIRYSRVPRVRTFGPGIHQERSEERGIPKRKPRPTTSRRLGPVPCSLFPVFSLRRPNPHQENVVATQLNRLI